MSLQLLAARLNIFTLRAQLFCTWDEAGIYVELRASRADILAA
jgi:hypothetical protein